MWLASPVGHFLLDSCFLEGLNSLTLTVNYNYFWLVLGRKRAWLVGAGVNRPHRSRFCVREEHEPREDTVGAFDAHQSILFGGLQEDGLILL